MTLDEFNLRMDEMIVAYQESRRFLEYHWNHADNNKPVSECECDNAVKFRELMNEYDYHRNDIVREFEILSNRSEPSIF